MSAKASKIFCLRYVGQGGAGNFTLCRDYAGKPPGTPVVLNHVHPGGLCFDLTPEYDKTHFLGRGISPSNRSQLIVVDEQFRTLNSYQLRYKIRGIESGSKFYVTFDDPKLSAEASEVKVAEVISGTGWRR